MHASQSRRQGLRRGRFLLEKVGGWRESAGEEAVASFLEAAPSFSPQPLVIGHYYPRTEEEEETLPLFY